MFRVGCRGSVSDRETEVGVSQCWGEEGRKDWSLERLGALEGSKLCTTYRGHGGAELGYGFGKVGHLLYPANMAPNGYETNHGVPIRRGVVRKSPLF